MTKEIANNAVIAPRIDSEPIKFAVPARFISALVNAFVPIMRMCIRVQLKYIFRIVRVFVDNKLDRMKVAGASIEGLPSTKG